MRPIPKLLLKALPAAFLAGLALLIWRIFFPALMSADPFAQFRQAWDGVYTDWHPPLMAIVLHQLFRLGHGIGAVACGQCVAGLLGVRALVLAWLAAFFGPAMPPRRAEGIAIAGSYFWSCRCRRSPSTSPPSGRTRGRPCSCSGPAPPPCGSSPLEREVRSGPGSAPPS
jgi:hypothetical protein